LSRLDSNDLVQRPPNEGLVKLHCRPNREKALELIDQWPGHHHLLHRDCSRLIRQWDMVQPSLRQVFLNLAVAKLRWPLYLWGPVGSGKTRAALAFCDLIVHSLYWTVDEVMDSIIGRRPPWHDSGVELAVLDELGQPRPGNADEFDYSTVKQFLDWRESRPAVYITNLAPDKQSADGEPSILDHYDRRIASRLTSGTVHKLVDRDRRRR
jgi:hypothetical protein